MHRPLPHARYKLNRKIPITIQRSLHTTILHELSATQTSGTRILAYIIIRANSDVKGFSKLCSNQEYTASKLFPYLKFKAKLNTKLIQNYTSFFVSTNKIIIIASNGVKFRWRKPKIAYEVPIKANKVIRM